MKGKGIQCNIEKSFLVQTEMGYLCLWVTHDGITSTNKKIEAINNMNPPTFRKELGKFVGVVNYYRNMWPRWPHTLVPLN